MRQGLSQELVRRCDHEDLVTDWLDMQGKGEGVAGRDFKVSDFGELG